MGQISAHALSLTERRELCLELLQEFGASSVTVNDRTHEIVHSCCLPFGGHSSGDRHPSASLNYDKLTYICRAGCGSGGLLWFVGVCRGTDIGAVRKWLSTTSGTTEESVGRLVDFIASTYSPEEEAEAPIPSFSPRVLEPWAWVHPYLTEIRGVRVENIVACQVGFDPSDCRIVVPHFWRDSLVGWQKRRLVDDGTPKWQSSPDFPKARTLYRLPERGVTPVVVEAPLSVVARHHVVPGMTATFGAQVSDRQVRLLSRYPEVVLWFDNDPAGWEATEAVATALSRSCVVRVVASPYAADPADVSDDEAQRLVASAVPFPLWKRPDELIAWTGEVSMRKYGTPERLSTIQEDPQGVSPEEVEQAAAEEDEDQSEE